jgi:hypothetical protein
VECCHRLRSTATGCGGLPRVRNLAGSSRSTRLRDRNQPGTGISPYRGIPTTRDPASRQVNPLTCLYGIGLLWSGVAATHQGPAWCGATAGSRLVWCSAVQLTTLQCSAVQFSAAPIVGRRPVWPPPDQLGRHTHHRWSSSSSTSSSGPTSSGARGLGLHWLL